VRLQGLVEPVAYHAGLHHGVHAVDTDLLDPLHPLHVHHDPADDGHCRPHQPGARPPGDEGDFVFVGQLHDLLDLYRVLRPHHRVGHPPVDPAVEGIHIELRHIGAATILPDDPDEFLDYLFLEWHLQLLEDQHSRTDDFQ